MKRSWQARLIPGTVRGHAAELDPLQSLFNVPFVELVQTTTGGPRDGQAEQKR
jgi:hypothetical protein